MSFSQTALLGDLLEAVDQPAQRLDHQLRRIVLAIGREADDVAEQDGDVGEAARPHLVGRLQLAHRLVGKDRAQEAIGPPPFFLDAARVGRLMVAQPLAAQRRVDAGLEQGRIERLGNVILGAELDRLDDVLQVLGSRDDDDADMAQPRVGAHAAQHLEAVDLRHHDVEQHEIDVLALELVQRLAAVGRLDHALIALALQPTGERIAVVLDVVDDQDQRRVGHGAPRASNSCILASRRSISIGLVS